MVVFSRSRGRSADPGVPRIGLRRKAHRVDAVRLMQGVTFKSVSDCADAVRLMKNYFITRLEQRRLPAAIADFVKKGHFLPMSARNERSLT